jgi:hypothetical protein
MEAHTVVRHQGLRIFLDSRLTDGSKAISLMCRSPFTPKKISGTHFCQRLSQPQSHSLDGRIRSVEKSSDIIGNLMSVLVHERSGRLVLQLLFISSVS